MIKYNKYTFISMLFMLIIGSSYAQEFKTIRGAVYSAESGKPIKDARIFSASAVKSSFSDSTGHFTINVKNANAELIVDANLYYTGVVPLLDRSTLNVYLMSERNTMYTDTYTTIDGDKAIKNKNGTAVSINKKDLNTSLASVDDALAGKIAGLRVVNKSGMPGEGSFVNMRGIRSLSAENSPLIVVDGMPYLPDTKTSMVIDGFSRNMFMPTNMKDIESVTLLKGADAVAYGSMAGNGVLLIETEKATDLETKVEFYTVNGVGVVSKKIPVLNPESFKGYVSDLGETIWSDFNYLMDRFPFLKDDPKYHYNYLYNNETDWQDEIYTPAISSENVLKVKGGDAIAKYALSVGYLYNKGVMENTQQSKYYTRLNSDINITRKVTMFTTVGFNYSDYDLSNQGMADGINPLLAALRSSPLMSVYEQNREKQNLKTFNPVGTSMFGVSNPKALVNKISAHSRVYDVLLNIGLNYNITTHLKFNALGGLYYDYVSEEQFIPGKETKTITMTSQGTNIVRKSIGEGLNYYFRGGLSYNNTFKSLHEVSASVGYQLITSRKEMDCGSGSNTPSDFYHSLDKIETKSRQIKGYNEIWNWMNAYFTATYGYDHQYYLTLSSSFDAASSYGKNSGRVFMLPSAKLSWNAKNSPYLKDVDLISNLTLRAEYGMTGNSRYSSLYSQYHYRTQAFQDMTTLVRGGLANSFLGPEKVYNTNFGVDFAMLGNRVNLSFDVFQERTRDMLMEKEVPASYGYPSMFDNVGDIRTRGVELSLHMDILERNGFYFGVGGNISTARSKIMSLGGQSQQITYFSDGAQLLSRVGNAPNVFYGYQSEGVITTKSESDYLLYSTDYGRRFKAGDIKFTDVYHDHTINEKDMVEIGNPAPDFFGGFYANLSYKRFSLLMNFTYSYGNEVYNAVRRGSESMSGFNNQSKAVERRWKEDGQITDIPRVLGGDPMGNGRFSSRWIEDGSYLKLKEVTLSYEMTSKFWFFTKLKAYVSADNLLTFTKYLGYDPEFAYSYDPILNGMDLGKIPVPKMVKLGLILNF